MTHRIKTIMFFRLEMARLSLKSMNAHMLIVEFKIRNFQSLVINKIIKLSTVLKIQRRREHSDNRQFSIFVQTVIMFDLKY